MSIHKIGSDLIRPAGSQGARRGTASSQQTDGDEARRVERADRVDISAEGRELAAQLVQDGEGLNESRTRLIQDRIQDGYYNDPAVAEKVAERLLGSGHLDLEA